MSAEESHLLTAEERTNLAAMFDALTLSADAGPAAAADPSWWDKVHVELEGEEAPASAV